jgi:hypothetical protein
MKKRPKRLFDILFAKPHSMKDLPFSLKRITNRCSSNTHASLWTWVPDGPVAL